MEVEISYKTDLDMSGWTFLRVLDITAHQRGGKSLRTRLGGFDTLNAWNPRLKKNQETIRQGVEKRGEKGGEKSILEGVMESSLIPEIRTTFGESSRTRTKGGGGQGFSTKLGG